MPAKVVVERDLARGAAPARRAASSAFSAVNSGIQVLPSEHRSGSVSPAYAVSSFSCAAVHGSFCTSTSMSGRSRRKSCEQLDGDLAFAPDGPETHDIGCRASGACNRAEPLRARPARASSADDSPSDHELGCGGGGCASQPPVKPARSSPRRMCGLRCISFQMSPLR